MNEDAFLKEVETRARMTRDQAYKVVQATFQELHDRLSPKEADDLSAQLPGEFKRMWHALDAPGREVRRTHKQDFIKHITDAAAIDEVSAIQGLMAVFKALHIMFRSKTGMEGEAWNVFSQLPKDLKHLWTAASSLKPPKEPKAQASAR